MLTRAAVATLLGLLVSAFAILPVGIARVKDDPIVTPGNGGGEGTFDMVTLFVETINETALGAAQHLSPNHSDSQRQFLPAHPADPMSGIGQFQAEDYCGWSALSTPLDPGDPAWDGHSTADGSVMWKSCAILGPGTPGAPGNPDGRSVVLQFFPNAILAAAAVPPPDPALIAERAIRELHVPRPLIGSGPDSSKLAVNLWTWLWIDDPGPLTATAAAGGISVTATASLSSVTWSLGEPAATGGPYADGPPVTLTCQGTGTPPPANYDWKAEPPCGHMYTWRSTKERTSGTGTWPITATSNWTVTWQSNTGVTGGTTLSATSNDALEIGEYRTVLVDGPGG